MHTYAEFFKRLGSITAFAKECRTKDEGVLSIAFNDLLQEQFAPHRPSRPSTSVLKSLKVYDSACMYITTVEISREKFSDDTFSNNSTF